MCYIIWKITNVFKKYSYTPNAVEKLKAFPYFKHDTLSRDVSCGITLSWLMLANSEADSDNETSSGLRNTP